MTAYEQGLLSRDKFYKSVYHLVEAGHNFISIDSNLLSHALEKGEKEFKVVANTLFTVDADLMSHFNVMKKFLKSIWCGRMPTLLEKKATSILIERIFLREWKKMAPELSPFYFIEKLDIILKEYDFHINLLRWLEGHFLLLPQD
jgi:hypothetical protein